MGRLLLLFILVPAVELALLIEIGRRIGTPATLGLIALTGALGAYLARVQGLGVIRKMQEETAGGRIPAAPIMDGVLILVAGAVLMTPGVLTDIFGFFCLIPPCRELLKRLLKRWLDRAIERGRLNLSVHVGGRAPQVSRREVRDVTPREARATDPSTRPRIETNDGPDGTD